MPLLLLNNANACSSNEYIAKQTGQQYSSISSSTVKSEKNACCCYLCNECPRSFANLEALHLHLRQHSSGEAISCYDDGEEGASSIITDIVSCDTAVETKHTSTPSTINELDEGASTTLVSASSSEMEDEIASNCFKADNYAVLTKIDSSLKTDADHPDSDNEDGGTHSEDCYASETSTSSPSPFSIASANMSFVSKRLADTSPTTDESPVAVTTKRRRTAGAVATHSFPCLKCDRVFTHRDQLNVHYTHTHRERPQYACEMCARVFLVKRELSTHQRVHSGEQPHRCQQCGKEFGTRQLLKKHTMWHTGERTHTCPHCGRSFFQKGHLTQHLMIHDGKRPHRCMLCAKTFIFKFDLNRHVKIHAERVRASALAAAAAAANGDETQSRTTGVPTSTKSNASCCAHCGKRFVKLNEHLLKCKQLRRRRSDVGSIDMLNDEYVSKSSTARRQSSANEISTVNASSSSPIQPHKPSHTEQMTPPIKPPTAIHFDDVEMTANTSSQQQQLLNHQRLLTLKLFATALRSGSSGVTPPIVSVLNSAPPAPASSSIFSFDPKSAMATGVPSTTPFVPSPPFTTALSASYCTLCELRFNTQIEFLQHWSATHSNFPVRRGRDDLTANGVQSQHLLHEFGVLPCISAQMPLPSSASVLTVNVEKTPGSNAILPVMQPNISNSICLQMMASPCGTSTMASSEYSPASSSTSMATTTSTDSYDNNEAATVKSGELQHADVERQRRRSAEAQLNATRDELTRLRAAMQRATYQQQQQKASQQLLSLLQQYSQQQQPQLFPTQLFLQQHLPSTTSQQQQLSLEKLLVLMHAN